MARIYRRAKTWYSDVYLPAHPKADSAGRVRVPLSKDQRIALQKLSDLASMADADKHGHAPADISYEQFKEKFIAWATANKAKTTVRHDTLSLKTLEEHENPQRLSQITPELLERFQGVLKNSGIINSYVNRRIRSLKAMMRKAEAWGYVKPQKWETIRQLPEPKGRLLYYTVNEIKALIAHCEGVWKTIAMLGARAGLRRGEIYWLDWESVDADRNRLHVAPRYDDGGKLLWSPKDHERRWIPMSADLRAYLLALPRAGKWVIEKNGKRPGLEVMSTYFRKLSKAISLKGNLHTLRHTFASHLISSGKVTLREIQDLLGHSSIEQTQVYAHLMPERIEAAVTHLPDLGTIVPCLAS